MGLPGISSALAVVLVAGACASSPQATTETATTTPTPQGGGIAVRVENNRPDASVVLVYVVPESGIRRLLGEVRPGNFGNFSFQGPAGSYTFVATGGGSDLTSQRFRILANTASIRWDLSLNRVTLN